MENEQQLRDKATHQKELEVVIIPVDWKHKYDQTVSAGKSWETAYHKMQQKYDSLKEKADEMSNSAYDYILADGSINTNRMIRAINDYRMEVSDGQ